MSKRGSYVEYAAHTEFKAQCVLSGSGSVFSLVAELERLHTRRVLFICSRNVKKYKVFEELNEMLLAKGMRLFTFEKETGLLKQESIDKALGMFREYNCDTVITVGGTSDIDCGKAVIAMADTPSAKKLADIAGDGNVKNGKYNLCCIAMDAGASCATPFTEFVSESDGKWLMVRSNVIIPDVVVIDTELSMRTEHEAAVDSALTAFCEAIESYISPLAGDDAAYKADAAIACGIIYDSLNNMRKDPQDSYLRYKTAVGGFYAGLSVRKTGIGYTHIAVHKLIERYGDIHGAAYMKLLRYLVEAQKDLCNKALGELARYLSICTQNADDERAASNLIDRLDHICSRYEDYIRLPRIEEREAMAIADEVRREASLYDLYKLESRAFADMLMAACSHE